MVTNSPVLLYFWLYCFFISPSKTFQRSTFFLTSHSRYNNCQFFVCTKCARNNTMIISVVHCVKKAVVCDKKRGCKINQETFIFMTLCMEAFNTNTIFVRVLKLFSYNLKREGEFCAKTNWPAMCFLEGVFFFAFLLRRSFSKSQLPSNRTSSNYCAIKQSPRKLFCQWRLI